MTRKKEDYKTALLNVRHALFEYKPNLDLIEDTLWMPNSIETVLDYINDTLDDPDYIDPSQR